MVARTGAVPTKPEHFNGKTKKQGGPAFAAPPRYCGDPQICPAIQVLLPRQDSAISAVLIPLLTSVLALLASAWPPPWPCWPPPCWPPPCWPPPWPCWPSANAGNAVPIVKAMTAPRITTNRSNLFMFSSSRVLEMGRPRGTIILHGGKWLCTKSLKSS